MHRKLRLYLVSLCKLKQFSDVQFKEFQFLIDSNKKLLFRVIWFFILISCLCTCCYQIQERILYFLSTPFKVDVEVGDLNLIDEFEMQFCSGFSQHVIQVLYKKWIILTNWATPFPILSIILLLSPHKDYSLDKLWHFSKNKRILKNVSFFNGREQEFLDLDSISRNNEITILGFCTTINLAGDQIKQEFQIDFAEEQYQPSSKLLLINIKSDISRRMKILSNNSYILRVLFRKYKHEKRKDFKGVSRQVLKDCIAKCFAEKSNKLAKCRLPVHSKNISLPRCKESMDIQYSYLVLFALILSPDKYDECRKDCMWLNNGIAFSLHAESVMTPNINRINIRMDKSVVIFTERFVYDGIHLLKDFGGILNLFAGLSILIIFDMVFNTFNYIRLKQTLNIIYKTNTKFKKIDRKFDMYFASLSVKWNIAQININVQKQRLMTKMLRVGVYIFCSILAILTMYQCIDRYFQYPIRFKIEIQSNNTVIFPSITVCHLADRINILKQLLSRRNSPKNWCKIDLLDLLNLSKSMTIDFLWQKSARVTFYWLNIGQTWQ